MDLINYLKSTEIDVLIVNQGLLTALIPIIKKYNSKIKIVAWQHNEFDIYVYDYNKRHINNYIAGVSRADLLVCLTEVDQSKFINLNEKSSFIYNPLTIDNKKETSALNSNSIIFVGRLNIKQKGLDYLINLAENLKDGWQLLIAGDGPDKNKFIQMIKKSKLEDKIFLKGPLAGQELFDFYKSGSIFISTSRWEGFGLVLTEAMSFGLPIVSFDNSGPKEILNNGEFGVLVEKDNINEFSSKLDYLIENPIQRQYYQQKSLERIKSFSMETIAEKWEIKLKKVLSNKSDN